MAMSCPAIVECSHRASSAAPSSRIRSMPAARPIASQGVLSRAHTPSESCFFKEAFHYRVSRKTHRCKDCLETAPGSQERDDFADSKSLHHSKCLHWFESHLKRQERNSL
jgi:hypothetical protein